MNPRFSADIPSCNQNATLSFPHLCNGYPFKPWNVHEIILSLIFLPSSSNPQREYLESILPLHPDISMWSLWSYEQMKNQLYWCLGEGRRDLTKEKPFLGPVWEITATDLQLRAGPGRELGTGYLPELLARFPAAEQAGGSWSKPGWRVSVVWLKHKIIQLHIGGLGILMLYAVFHIYSYWVAPTKIRSVLCRPGNQTPRCGVQE